MISIRFSTISVTFVNELLIQTHIYVYVDTLFATIRLHLMRRLITVVKGLMLLILWLRFAIGLVTILTMISTVLILKLTKILHFLNI